MQSKNVTSLNESDLTAEEFIKQLSSYLSPEAIKKSDSYSPKKQQEEGIFDDVRMGQVFALAKEFINTPLDEVEKLLENPVHKVRVGAVSIMDFQARSKKFSEAQKKEVFELYIRRHDCINTWDLVDRSGIHVVGGYLFDKPEERKILYKLAMSEMMAERRTAIVATLYFIMKGDTKDTFKIAEQLLNDKEDLIHKATGWALRTAGGDELIEFLDKHASKMPRVTLRYAIEKFPKETRQHYLNLKKA